MIQIFQYNIDFDIQHFNQPLLNSLFPCCEVCLSLTEVIIMNQSSIFHVLVLWKTNNIDFTDFNYSFILTFIIVVNQISKSELLDTHSILIIKIGFESLKLKFDWELKLKQLSLILLTHFIHLISSNITLNIFIQSLCK